VYAAFKPGDVGKMASSWAATAATLTPLKLSGDGGAAVAHTPSEVPSPDANWDGAEVGRAEAMLDGSYIAVERYATPLKPAGESAEEWFDKDDETIRIWRRSTTSAIRTGAEPVLMEGPKRATTTEDVLKRSSIA
jgi:hypothetical protein